MRDRLEVETSAERTTTMQMLCQHKRLVIEISEERKTRLHCLLENICNNSKLSLFQTPISSLYFLSNLDFSMFSDIEC